MRVPADIPNFFAVRTFLIKTILVSGVRAFELRPVWTRFEVALPPSRRYAFIPLTTVGIPILPRTRVQTMPGAGVRTRSGTELVFADNVRIKLSAPPTIFTGYYISFPNGENLLSSWRGVSLEHSIYDRKYGEHLMKN